MSLLKYYIRIPRRYYVKQIARLTTKYFSHYKNKPYKYIGTAKHSETLEDYVIYECHQNSSARVWIRPQKMFFESVEIEGKSTPRFQQIPINIEIHTQLSEFKVEILFPLIQNNLSNWSPNRLFKLGSTNKRTSV